MQTKWFIESMRQVKFQLHYINPWLGTRVFTIASTRFGPSMGEIGMRLWDDLKIRKSKIRNFVPFSFPYPPTIKRDILIRNIFIFLFPTYPPYQISDISEKNLVSQHISSKFERDKKWSKNYFPLSHPNLTLPP